MLLHKIIIRAVALLVIAFWLFSFGWILAESPVWSIVLPSVVLSAVMALGFVMLHNFGRLAFLVLWMFLVGVAVQQWWGNACCDGLGRFSAFSLGQLLQSLAEWPLYFLVFSIYLFHPSTAQIFHGFPRFFRGENKTLEPISARVD